MCCHLRPPHSFHSHATSQRSRPVDARLSIGAVDDGDDDDEQDDDEDEDGFDIFGE
jgi:hypothetical protein